VTAWLGMWLAQQDDQTLLLGEDFLPWMVLAFGAALVVGPLFALVRPPTGDRSAERPPLARTLTMVVIGAIASVWGFASLLS
jgi:hypothetical protein